MDPISAAGIGLAIAPLLFQVFAGCIKGYQLLAEVEGMPAAYQHLRVRLRMEQGRLLNWGEKVGLVEGLLERSDQMPNQDLQLNRNVVIDVLLEIQMLIKSCVKIANKYDRIVPVKSSLPNFEASFDRRFPKGTNRILGKVLNVFEKVPQTGARLQWATVKQDSFKSNIQKLIGYNDFIETLLDRNTADQLQAMQHQSYMIMLQLNTKVDELKEMSMAMQVPTGARSGDMAPGFSRASTMVTERDNENATIALLADFKASFDSIENEDLMSNLEPIVASALSLSSPSRVRSDAIYQGRSVWMEWKTYDSDDNYPSWWDAMIEDRVKRLVTLLGSPGKPKQFRAPNCVGYIHNSSEGMQEYAFVYEKPSNAMATSNAVTLQELMTTTRTPSLTKRVAIACAIAQSLMYLHSVNWLHKAVRSSNIVFFVSSGETPDYRQPLLSGFEYARPDMTGETTEPMPKLSENDLYKHPLTLGSVRPRSKKSDDIYSLGVLLVEIARWKPISDIIIIPSERKAARTVLKNARGVLLDKQHLATVEDLAGEAYTEVVRKCLEGVEALGVSKTADETDPEVGAAMLQAFSAEVVDRLDSIRI